MTSRSLPARLSRLDALAERLSDGAVHAIATLSEELGVSPRTLARDLALLREQGWELESSSGRAEASDRPSLAIRPHVAAGR